MDMMKFRRATITATVCLQISSSYNRQHTTLFCSGFALNRDTNQPNRGNKRKKQRDNDYSKQIIEDAVVRDVSAKVQPRSSNKSPPKLNARQKSFIQRDPIISLNMNLDHLAKSGQSAERCEEMLLRIEALHDDGYYEKAPDVVSYNSVINAYAHQRIATFSRSKNAKRIMKQMEMKGITPNTVTYNTLLRCFQKEVGGKQHSRHSMSSEETVQEAESILRSMEESKLANTISYNTAISILSRSGLKDAPERAQGWLNRMISLYNETLKDKIKPDTTSFNACISAFANSSPARASEAEQLLLQMEKLHASGENSDVKPDVVSYTTVINACAKVRSDESAAKAIKLLDHMNDLYKKGDKNVKPNQRTYTSVINALGRTGNPEVADDLLSNMKAQYKQGDKSLAPDTVCYSSVINGYSIKGGEESAFRAEELLHEMEDLYNSGNYNVKPNTQTYRSVITAYGKSRQPRAAEKAEQILEQMEYYSSQGAKDVSPNTIVYNAVIDAFARSKTVSKAYRAELLLEKMMEESSKGRSSIKPDTITFNSVISAAARSTLGDSIVRKEAFNIGLNAFRLVHNQDHCRPSSVTYISYLKLLKNLTEEGDSREHMAERVYKLAVQRGLANDAVRSQLIKTCSPLAAQRIISLCEKEYAEKDERYE